MLANSILFENDELIIINKPNGLAVQGGQGILHSLDSDLSEELGYKVHLVHRLDKETSGLMIVAKNAKAAAKWTNKIAEKEVKKEYEAVCFGFPVIKNKETRAGTLTQTVEAHGRELCAKTDFYVVETKTVCGLKMSLVHLTLGTGRMHQIRIQLAKALCPIVADDRHGDFKKNKVMRKEGVKKLCLASVRLTLPLTPSDIRTFEVPLPPYMRDCFYPEDEEKNAD